MFYEDGAPCLRQQSLKMVFNHHVTVEGQPTERSPAFSFSLPLPLNIPSLSMTELENEVAKQLTQGFHKEVTTKLGRMLVDVSVDDNAVSKDGGELKVEKTIQPCPPLALPQRKETTFIKASVDDYNLLFGHMDNTARNSCMVFVKK